jgi:thiol peroxidase
MATVTFKGKPVKTVGDLPPVGSKAPDFRLTTSTLADVSLADFRGKKKIMTVNPSYDTSVCQVTARSFNERAGRLGNTAVLAISADLPFAQQRFCEAEGLKQVTPLSMLRSRDFGRDYGLLLVDGPMAGLLGRAVIVLSEQDQVLYTELVPEITSEPNYGAALKAAGG